MNHNTGISRRKAWLISLASMLDEVALLALVFLALKLFHIELTWPVILSVSLAAGVYFVIIHRAVMPAICRRKQTGAEGMIGMTGIVTRDLQPQGIVKVENEYWRAKAAGDNIAEDEEVEVVGINRLVLEVKRKRP